MKAEITTVSQDSIVLSLTKAGQMLAQAVTIGETKQVLAVAAAAETYAKRQHLSAEVAQMATTIRYDAERQIGMMLKQAPKATAHLQTVGTKSVPTRNEAPTLAELGITKKESAQAQQLARLPRAAFEEVRSGKTTVAKALKAAFPPAAKPGARMKPAAAVDVTGEDAGFGDGDVLEKWSAEVTENTRLNELIGDLTATDLGKKIKEQAEIIAGLTGRLNASMNAQYSMEKQQKFHANFVHKLRKIFGVDTHEEIIRAAEEMVA